MTVGRYYTADEAMIKREGAELLGDEDNREPLAFVGAESTGGHYLARLHSERKTIIIKSRDEDAVAGHKSV